MVRINRMSEDDMDEDVAHLWLEETAEDNLMPKALCGEITMGHFYIIDAKDAPEELEAVDEEAVDGLGDLLSVLVWDGLMCWECLERYQEEVGEISGLVEERE